MRKSSPTKDIISHAYQCGLAVIIAYVPACFHIIHVCKGFAYATRIEIQPSGKTHKQYKKTHSLTHSDTQTLHTATAKQGETKKNIRTKRQSEKKNKSISRIKQVILQPISVSFQLPAVLALVFLFSPSAMSIYVLRTRTFTVYIHILYIW